MGIFLYNVAVRLYHFMIGLAAFFNEKAKKFTEGRKQTWERLSKVSREHSWVWFHCASLGEYEQARPLILSVKERGYKVLVTFFSPSGYELKQNEASIDLVCYLPMDSPENARKLLSEVQPKLIVFIKYEFWYHYLRESFKRQIPVINVGAFFRREQLFFKMIGGVYRKLLHYFTYLFVINEDSKALLETIGIRKVKVIGDTRFDRVVQIPQSAKENTCIKQFQQNKTLLIAGSVWNDDMKKALIPFINTFDKDIKFIIAPHEINYSLIAKWQKLIKHPSVLYSEIDPSSVHAYQVLLIDNIGMLAELYQYADMAYVGGAFKQGLHNILEPAVFGIPVIWGKKYQNFPEAVEMLKHGGYSVLNASQLHKVVERLCDDPLKRTSKGQDNLNFVYSSTGGNEKIMKTLIDENIIH